jgi:ferredoxin
MARLAPTNEFTERAGEYFIKDTCIDCDLCRQTAPLFFTRRSVGNAGITEVPRQPLTLQEHHTCRDALEACPVEAIGYKLF